MSGHIQASPPERYEAISHHLLTQARIELNKGDILQASDKVWGSTAHALKAVCQRMGWNHHAHNHINAAANYIATELGREDLRRDFVYVESLHTKLVRTPAQHYRNPHRPGQRRVAHRSVGRTVAAPPAGQPSAAFRSGNE